MNQALLALQQLLSFAEAGQIDDPGFIARIAGAHRQCDDNDNKCDSLVRAVYDRVGRISLATFKLQAAIGIAFLHVQQKRPGEFGDWFKSHQATFKFSERQAERYKAYGQDVLEHGMLEAYRFASDPPKRVVAASMRLPLAQDAEKLSEERALEYYEKADPTYRALVARIAPEALGALDEVSSIVRSKAPAIGNENTVSTLESA